MIKRHEEKKRETVQPALQKLSVSTARHQYSDQYFQITELRVYHHPALRTKVTQDKLALRYSDPPRGGRPWAPVLPGLL